MQHKLFWIIVIAMLLLAGAIAINAPVANHEEARKMAEIAPAPEAWRAALPRDPEQATDAYMARIPLAAQTRSNAYFEGGYWMQGIGYCAGVAASLLILASGVLARWRDALARRTGRRWLINAILIAAFLLLNTLLLAPFQVYNDYYREQLYGLANQSLGPWLIEALIGTLIAAVQGTLIISILYQVLLRAPKTWWIWGAAVSVGSLSLMMLIGPSYIDPLFNTYTPVKDQAIKQRIMSLASANGVATGNVFEYDESRQSNRVGAKVNGIFGTVAIRLNDNLLKRTSLPEIDAVVGHELGHYVLNHVYSSLLTNGVILILGFVLLKQVSGWALRRFGAKWGIHDVADPVGLPLLALILSTFMFLMTPLNNTIVRTEETAADVFGINASKQPDGMAEVHLKLVEYRKANPGALEEFFFFDHPSPRKRILMAMRWKAEHGKQP